MNATEKMRALGMKALLERVHAYRPGTALETLYRWAQSIDSGRGIKDENKRVLVQATAGSDHAIGWADFEPVHALGDAA